MCIRDRAKTLKALGLGKIGSTVEQVDNDAIRGMIFKVKHLIEVENLSLIHIYIERCAFLAQCV